MKTINPHTLITDNPKTFEVCPSITEIYNLWKKIMSEKTDSEMTVFDAFIAGYFLANPSLRDKYKMTGISEKRDNRIQNVN